MDTASDASSSELYNHSCTTIVHKYTVHCCLPASFTKAETRYDWVKEERMNAQFYGRHGILIFSWWLMVLFDFFFQNHGIRAVRNPDIFLFTVCSVWKNLQHQILIFSCHFSNHGILIETCLFWWHHYGHLLILFVHFNILSILRQIHQFYFSLISFSFSLHQEASYTIADCFGLLRNS